MDCPLTTIDQNHEVKMDIEMTETVMQEQFSRTILIEDIFDEDAASGAGRNSEAKNDLIKDAEANSRKSATSVQCPKCRKLFGNRKLLRFHMRKTHSGAKQRPEICPICPRHFKCKNLLFIHMKNHREKVCPICYFTVSDSGALKNHVESLHIGKLDLVCLICSKLSVDSASHDDHVSSHNGGRRYECVDCSKYYASREGLERHRQKHVGITKNKLQVQYICPTCSKAYTAKRKLRKHMNIHTGLRPYQCEQCLNSYTSAQALQKHLETHIDSSSKITERKYKCSYCLKSYTTNLNLRYHLNIHTGAEPFKCDQCPKSFRNPWSLQTHSFRHKPGGRPLKCPVCCRILNDSQSLRFHMNIHTDRRPYQCEQCPKRFATPSSRRNHREKHLAGDSNLKCPICLKTLSRPYTLRLHMNTHCDTRPYQCDECPKSYSRPSYLEKHRELHLIGSHDVKCSICSKFFTDARKLRYHMSDHTGSHPYKCDQCPERYASPQALQSHHNTHIQDKTPAGKRSFRCDQCPKRFTSSWSHTKHREGHSQTDKSDYKCFVCSDVFTEQRSLLLHMKSHNEAPFKCRQCEDVFSSCKDLIVHLRHNHPSHDEIEHKCSICSKHFSSKTTLNKHMKTHSDYFRRIYEEFHSNSSLVEDRQSHLTDGKSPYKCSICFEIFTDLRVLVAHMNIHDDGTRPFKCDQCPKCYPTSRGLIVHQKKHLTAEPKECTVDRSDKSLHEESKDGELDKTVDLHATQENYKCKECDKEFICERNLIFHLRLHEKKTMP